MVAAVWRHGSLAVLAATLLVAHQAAADPSLHTSAEVSQSTHPEATLLLSRQATAQLLPEASLERRPSLQLLPEASSPLSSQASWQLIPQVNAQLVPQVTVQKVGSVLDRVPTASWAMGCAAGIALAMHAVYQTSSDRHRTRMKSCADDCSNYRIDDYKETRERADVALRLSVFAAASALWLVYNDPQEALERMGQRKLPRQQPGFRVKVKPERRGVWASVVAYF